MVRSFDELPAFTNRMAKDVEKAATKIMRQLAVGIGATLVDTTRVDTGAARSNWRATLNAPATGVIPPYAPGNKLGKGETANATGAKSQQGQVFARFNAKKHKAIFITNNIHYIGMLNDGRSGIKGDFMVEQAVQTGKLILQSLRVMER